MLHRLPVLRDTLRELMYHVEKKHVLKVGIPLVLLDFLLGSNKIESVLYLKTMHGLSFLNYSHHLSCHPYRF